MDGTCVAFVPGVIMEEDGEEFDPTEDLPVTCDEGYQLIDDNCI